MRSSACLFLRLKQNCDGYQSRGFGKLDRITKKSGSIRGRRGSIAMVQEDNTPGLAPADNEA